MDDRLVSLLERQHGLVARWQVVLQRGGGGASAGPGAGLGAGLGAGASTEAGGRDRARRSGAATRTAQVAPWLTPGFFDGLLRRGHLETVARGVAMARGAAWSPEAQAMAAVLRSGPQARLVGPRLLAFLGLRGFARDGEFGVLVPTRRRHGRVTVRGQSIRLLLDPEPDDGTVQILGIPAPRVGRAMIEVAWFLQGDDLMAAIDAGRWAGKPDLVRLARAASRLPAWHRPARAVRALLASPAMAQESPGERAMVTALGPLAASFAWQVVVAPGLRVDGLNRPSGTVLEYQGGEYHSGVLAQQRDATRDERLRALGLRPLYVTADDCRDPAGLQRRVAAAIGRD